MGTVVSYRGAQKHHGCDVAQARVAPATTPIAVPPFPYRSDYPLSKGLPVLIQRKLTESEAEQLHYWEVASDNGQLVTIAILGQVMVVTGGPDVRAALAQAYRLRSGPSCLICATAMILATGSPLTISIG